jgi:hypothetical protein
MKKADASLHKRQVDPLHVELLRALALQTVASNWVVTGEDPSTYPKG